MAETMAAVRPRRFRLRTDAAALPADTAVLPAGAAALPAGTATLPAGAAALPTGAAALLVDAAALPAGTALTAGAACLPGAAADGVSFFFKCLAFFPLLPNNSILPLLPGTLAFLLVYGRQNTHCNEVS